MLLLSLLVLPPSLVSPDALLSLVKSELKPGSYMLKSSSAAARIDEACRELEADGVRPSFPRDLMSLDGEWRLIYSPALSPPVPEPLAPLLSGLADNLPAASPRNVVQRIDVTNRRVINQLSIVPWPSIVPPLGGPLAGLQEAEVTLELDHVFSVEGEGGSSGGRRQAAAGSVVDIRLEKIRRTLGQKEEEEEEEGWVDMMNPVVRAEQRRRSDADASGGGFQFGNPLLDLIPKQTAYDVPFPFDQLQSGSFDTPFVSGNVRISRGTAGGVAGLQSSLGVPELRIFERIGGGGQEVYRTWQEEEDALAAAAAAGDGVEGASTEDRWQEGGLEEAEAMDFDSDYDAECPDS